jgi:multiple sugar transport system substrate-binding protein
MKRVIIALLIVAMLVAAVGCTPQTPASSSAAAPASSAAAAALASSAAPASSAAAASASTASTGKGNVTIWYYWETQLHQVALNKMIDTFNKSQSDITVTAKYIPFADFKKQLSIGVAAENLPDLVIIDNPDHASYAAMGIFADLTGKFDTSNYFPGPISSCTLDNKLYGVPVGSNDLCLFYNTDMLKAAGVSVPKTWDELKAAAAKLTNGKVKGFAFSAVQNEEGTFGFLPWVWSTGATSYQINSDGGIKALTLIKDMFADGSMSKECINWTQGDVMNQFISGNCAMMMNGPWQLPTMRKDSKGINWDVALLPKDAKDATDLGGENWGVIKTGNVDAAVTFLKFATSKENSLDLLNALGYISSRSDIAATQFTDDKQMQVFTEALKGAQARGPHPKWPSISDAISLAFNEVITGASTPADAAKKAQTTIDGIIK